MTELIAYDKNNKKKKKAFDNSGTSVNSRAFHEIAIAESITK